MSRKRKNKELNTISTFTSSPLKPDIERRLPKTSHISDESVALEMAQMYNIDGDSMLIKRMMKMVDDSMEAKMRKLSPTPSQISQIKSEVLIDLLAKTCGDDSGEDDSSCDDDPVPVELEYRVVGFQPAGINCHLGQAFVHTADGGLKMIPPQNCHNPPQNYHKPPQNCHKPLKPSYLSPFNSPSEVNKDKEVNKALTPFNSPSVVNKDKEVNKSHTETPNRNEVKILVPESIWICNSKFRPIKPKLDHIIDQEHQAVPEVTTAACSLCGSRVDPSLFVQNVGNAEMAILEEEVVKKHERENGCQNAINTTRLCVTCVFELREIVKVDSEICRLETLKEERRYAIDKLVADFNMNKNVSVEDDHFADVENTSSEMFDHDYAKQTKTTMTMFTQPPISKDKSSSRSKRLRETVELISKFQCQWCSRRFDAIHQRQKHEENHRMQFHCNNCQKRFLTQDTLKNHTLYDHPVCELACRICGHVSQNQVEYNCHQDVKHPDTVCNYEKTKYLTSYEPGEKTLKCSYCDKRYTRVNHMKRHELIHRGEKPYTCELCYENFRSKSRFERHQEVHGGLCEMCGDLFTIRANHVCHVPRSDPFCPVLPKKYMCLYCSKGYSRMYKLRVHEQRFHRGKKPFKCEVCDASFGSNQLFKLHSGRCEICGCEFRCSTDHNCQNSSTSNLVRKIQKSDIGVGEEKQHICSYCGRGFMRRQNLQDHELSHTGEKPVLCEHCGTGFRNLKQLKRHVRLCQKCGGRFMCGKNHDCRN